MKPLPTAAGRSILYGAIIVSLFLVALVARWDWGARNVGRNLRPVPDAQEYAATAHSLARSGQYYLQIGPHRFRPRYSPGWPMFLSVAVYLGLDAGQLWRVTGVFGACLAVLIGAVAFRATTALFADRLNRGETGPWVAGLCGGAVAGVFYALAPVAVHMGESLMSDEPTLLVAWLALLAIVVAFHADVGKGRLAGVAGGLCLGMATAMRPVIGVSLAASLGLWWLLRARLLPAREFQARTLAAALGLAVAPTLTGWVLYRSGLTPWKWSGYDVWVPERFATLGSGAFDIAYALGGSPERPAIVGGEAVSHLHYGLLLLLGAPVFPPAQTLGNFWPIIGWCLFLALLWRFRGRLASSRLSSLVVVGSTWALIQLGLFATYLYQQPRLYLAPLSLAAAGAGIAVGWAMAASGLAMRAATAALTMALVASHVAGFVSFARAPSLAPRDHATMARTVKEWLARSDEERRLETLPFDPVVAQALGLLEPREIAAVREWGRLPHVPHVARLRRYGYLDEDDLVPEEATRGVVIADGR